MGLLEAPVLRRFFVRLGLSGLFECDFYGDYDWNSVGAKVFRSDFGRIRFSIYGLI